MSTVDFENILQRKPEEAEKPLLIPTGSYQGVVKRFELDKSSQKQTPFVRFFVSLQAPLDDVDLEVFEAIGTEKINKKEFRLDFYFTEDSEWRLREFLEHHVGLDIQGRSYDILINEAVGQPVGFVIKHTPTKDNTDTYAEIARTMAA